MAGQDGHEETYKAFKEVLNTTTSALEKHLKGHVLARHLGLVAADALLLSA